MKSYIQPSWRSVKSLEYVIVSWHEDDLGERQLCGWTHLASVSGRTCALSSHTGATKATPKYIAIIRHAGVSCDFVIFVISYVHTAVVVGLQTQFIYNQWISNIRYCEDINVETR